MTAMAGCCHAWTAGLIHPHRIDVLPCLPNLRCVPRAWLGAAHILDLFAHILNFLVFLHLLRFRDVGAILGHVFAQVLRLLAVGLNRSLVGCDLGAVLPYCLTSAFSLDLSSVVF